MSYPSGTFDGKLLYRRALESGYTRIALFSSINAYPHSVREGIISEGKNDGTIIFDQEIPPDLNDYRSFLAKAAAQKVDALYICLNPGQSGLFATQAKQLKLNLPIFGCINLESLSEVKLANGALEGAWFVTAGVQPWFQQEYFERFKNDEMLAGAGIHYDLLLDLEKISNLRGLELISALMKTENSGAMGRYRYSDDAGDKFLNLELVTKTIKSDGFATLSR